MKAFLNFTVTNMIQKCETQILCPCKACKNGIFHNPFDGSVLAHLLHRGFVEGYTRWTKHGEENDDDEGAVDMEAENPLNDQLAGLPEGGNNNEHAPGGGNDETPPEHEEDHVSQDMSLAEMLQDPHVKELLQKKTTNERASIKEALKLAQLELDKNAPLYEGCDPEHTRLHVTLKLLDIKARFKSTDASLDATLEYLHTMLPKGNLLPKSVDEAKKIV